MNQLESLFDTGASAWRLELRVKGGGGPFDPAGYSIEITDPEGHLHALEVHPVQSAEEGLLQLLDLLNDACLVIYAAMDNKAAAAEIRRLRSVLKRRGEHTAQELAEARLRSRHGS